MPFEAPFEWYDWLGVVAVVVAVFLIGCGARKGD